METVKPWLYNPLALCLNCFVNSEQDTIFSIMSISQMKKLRHMKLISVSFCKLYRVVPNLWYLEGLLYHSLSIYILKCLLYLSMWLYIQWEAGVSLVYRVHVSHADFKNYRVRELLCQMGLFPGLGGHFQEYFSTPLTWGDSLIWASQQMEVPAQNSTREGCLHGNSISYFLSA